MYCSPERLTVAAGHVIYAAGELASCAYLLLRGSVKLTDAMAPGRQVVRQAGEVFGDLALVDDAPRQWTAVALEACEMLAITSEIVSERVEVVDPLLRICLSAIVARYSETVDRMRQPEGFSAKRLRSAWTAHSEAAHDILSFEHQLRAGIERGELDLHFQPIVHLPTGRLAGLEGLIRWLHPDRGPLVPADFIPLAETSGVISDITALCLRKVGHYFPDIKAAAAANAAVADRPFVSINVSGLDLARSAFAASTVSTLCDAGVDPEDVRLEVTESILMKDAEKCARTLQNCRDQGLSIAIDDFGTGYSSLHYLNTLPISVLKMDQSFCRSLLSDTGGRKIIGAILHLGRELGLSVIAEGIELVSQRDLLTSMGCDFGQGYLFGAALDAEATLALIRGWDIDAGASQSLPVSPAA